MEGSNEGQSEKCIDRLVEYGLTREDLIDCLNGYPWEGTKSRFEEVDSKVRSSFTRKYNNREHLLANTFASGDSLVSQGKRRSVKRGGGKGENSRSKRGVSQQTMEKETSEEDDEDALFVIQRVFITNKGFRLGSKKYLKGKYTSNRF